jgi:3-deoxy-manno-octulosonate cytidylyltransferase (CMP-KDO synthetase)
VFLTSPDHPSGTDRVAEVASASQYRGYDTILNVQGDEPYVSDTAARAAVGLVADGGFDIATAACQGDTHDLESPDVVKVIVSDDRRALFFSRAPIPWLRDPEDESTRTPLIRRHIGLYAYTRRALLRWVALPVHPMERVERLEQLRPLMAGERIGVVDIPGRPLPGIDTEADLAFANEHWKTFNTGTLESRVSR